MNQEVQSVGFPDPAEQAGLSPAGVRVFANIMEVWEVGEEDAARLLGNVPLDVYRSLKENSEQARFGEDTLTRISLVTGIYKALHTLFGEKLAEQYVNLPNTNVLYQGVTPLAYMLREGTAGMWKVRRKLDADCQAPFL